MWYLQPVPFDPNYIEPVFGWTMVAIAWLLLFAIIVRKHVIDKIDGWAAKRRHNRREKQRAKTIAAAVKFGTMTANEARASMEYPSYSGPRHAAQRR